jgi:hypothetical protein
VGRVSGCAAGALQDVVGEVSRGAAAFVPGPEDARRVVASPRDLALLRLLGEQCALTQPQLARAIGRSIHTARWLRSRWQRAGWVESAQVVPGWPVSMWLTARGQAIAGLDFRVWRPEPNGRLRHIAYAAEARLHVRRRHPDAAWICERLLMRRWRRDGLKTHRPDAEVETARGLVAVEVELTMKGAVRFERIARELVGPYAAVWYFAPPERADALTERIKRAALARCHVVSLPDPWAVI